MRDRRSLIEGIKPAEETIDPQLEREFVYGSKARAGEATTVNVVPAPVEARSRLTTRIRSDIASALKRASLERQLKGIEPNKLQDILEQALEPWLKSNGYL